MTPLHVHALYQKIHFSQASDHPHTLAFSLTLICYHCLCPLRSAKVITLVITIVNYINMTSPTGIYAVYLIQFCTKSCSILQHQTSNTPQLQKQSFKMSRAKSRKVIPYSWTRKFAVKH